MLLLTLDRSQGTYRVSPSGAFVVRDSEVTPMVEVFRDLPLFERLKGMTLAQFEDEVTRVKRQAR